jgi:hypothetical protein
MKVNVLQLPLSESHFISTESGARVISSLETDADKNVWLLFNTSPDRVNIRMNFAIIELHLWFPLHSTHDTHENAPI